MNTKEKVCITASSDQGNIAAKKPDLVITVPQKPFYEFIKRLFDIVGSAVLILVLLLPMLVVALIVVLDSPGASPIFVQDRIGKNGRSFRFYKFRSMVPNAEQLLSQLLEQNEMEGPVFKMKDDPRITRVGRFIRKTSIDELPQLWNILKGDMSFVGPRPGLPREVEQYTAYHRQRLYIVPGLTCYWQVQPKRNSLSFDEWVALDLEYIQRRSFLLDLKLIFQTVAVVFGQEGE